MRPIILLVAVSALSMSIAGAADRMAVAAGPTPVAQGDPVERRTYQIKGTGYTKAEADREARSSAQFWIQLEGAKSYRVLSQSSRQVGDIYICTLSIEYYVRRYAL